MQPLHSLLFVPGDRPERFAKAIKSGAHATILDLEDSVGAIAKSKARDAIHAFFVSGGAALVRVNSPNTPWFDEDLRLCQELGVSAVVLPKTEKVAEIAEVARYLSQSAAVLPLIETARGMLNLRAITSANCVQRILFGSIDFCLDLGLEDIGETLNAHRAWLVLASRAAGLAAPIDGVTLNLQDESALRAATQSAKRQGFGGKLCIHPSQVAAVNHCFLPTPAQLKWARSVSDLAGLNPSGGAFEFEGKMVDAPIISRAHQILSLTQN